MSEFEAREATGGASEPPFEEALRELEAVVSRLESGELDLEAALAAFQRGIELVRICAARLDAAEKRVEMLVADAEGNPVARPFPVDEGAGA